MSAGRKRTPTASLGPTSSTEPQATRRLPHAVRQQCGRKKRRPAASPSPPPSGSRPFPPHFHSPPRSKIEHETFPLRRAIRPPARRTGQNAASRPADGGRGAGVRRHAPRTETFSARNIRSIRIATAPQTRSDAPAIGGPKLGRSAAELPEPRPIHPPPQTSPCKRSGPCDPSAANPSAGNPRIRSTRIPSPTAGPAARTREGRACGNSGSAAAPARPEQSATT